ncbi:MAG: dihydrofolate reductase [Cytophagales bacterium]|nr:dihydrofolate reductase [Cytophagales bacterium]
MVCLLVLLLPACESKVSSEEPSDFQYLSEQFADLQILRYKVPGFEELSLQQKEMLYYLYKAALSGRDIIYDQNYKHNLLVRRTLEAIVESYSGDRETEEFNKFMVYTKRVWFSNGIHHHSGAKKFLPDITPEYFSQLVKNALENKFSLLETVEEADTIHNFDLLDLILLEGETIEDFIEKLIPIILDPRVDVKRVNQNPDVDMITSSANNYYEGVTQQEVETYYQNVIDRNDTTPVSYGLNSKLVKENDQIKEKVWKIGGMYTEAIEQIVYWLEKASLVAENDQQKIALDKLIEYYKTGDLRKFDEYNIEWVKDTASRIDLVNGFIEVYGDALGYRAAYESVVSIKDLKATKRIAAIAKEAQWFEDNAPIMEEHKKKNVKGISAKVITVVIEGGDASPSTPIGINLPNAQWIRKYYGSKSVNLSNIKASYNYLTAHGGQVEEFYYTREEMERAKKHDVLADNLHTDLHEVIGHASGQLEPGVGTPKETLKNYASTLEEGRADLVALYYFMDEKLVEIGVMPSLEVGKAAYDDYISNGLMQQLKRLEEGDNLEQAHMRNRQMVAKWVYEKGLKENVIEKIMKKQGKQKTYFVVNDYQKLRKLFGLLLREIQRIKSQGDYEAGKNLVENYGVKVDQQLLKEVKKRYRKLGIPPYSGFIQPKLVPVYEGEKIIDVTIEYPDDFTEQMMEYGREYSFLPYYN